MKKKRYSEEQIIKILKEVESGTSVREVSRREGVTEPTIYRWRSRYGGLSESELRRLRELEAENARLKKIVADLTLDREMLQDVIRRKL